MIPFKSLISISRAANEAVYIQISKQIIGLIKEQVLSPNTKLPSSRLMAQLLGVHRKTIVACYEELIIQGWIITIPKKGTFVHNNIPVLRKRDFGKSTDPFTDDRISFLYQKDKIIPAQYSPVPKGFMTIKDGVGDERLAPVEEITQLYKNVTSRQLSREVIGYDTMYGNPFLRETLVTYLKETRGLNISKENVLITRGSQMGMFLTAQLLFQTGDIVVVGSTNYGSATRTFSYSGTRVMDIPVDSKGIVTEALETLCQNYSIKAVYVTPHHHYPTTVTLSAERRMHLLNLADTFGFAIIEDDYDYDFHYNHAPILPLASHDRNGHVIYLGSFCKTVAPVYRIGYLIAPKEFIAQCAELRGIIDRQGDSLLELTFANYIKNGGLDRHIRRVLKTYRMRRDVFCKELKNQLGDHVDFEIPLGGMAVWVRFNNNISLKTLKESAVAHKLVILNWDKYYSTKPLNHALRMGFAAYNEEENIEVISRLKRSIESSLK